MRFYSITGVNINSKASVFSLSQLTLSFYLFYLLGNHVLKEGLLSTLILILFLFLFSLSFELSLSHPLFILPLSMLLFLLLEHPLIASLAFSQGLLGLCLALLLFLRVLSRSYSWLIVDKSRCYLWLCYFECHYLLKP